MATIYSKVTGTATEVPDWMAEELAAFEESARGHVLANYSSKPVEWTHHRMTALGSALKKSSMDEAIDQGPEVTTPPPQDASGMDWAGLVN